MSKKKKRNQAHFDFEDGIAFVVHVDGGAFTEPPHYKFHDAYFSVVDDSGALIHFEKNIGDVWSGIAEYRAIEWAIKNITERPIKITSDCTIAMSWARKGKKKTPALDIILPPLLQEGIILEYQHGNKADIWNAEHHSPKPGIKFLGYIQ